MSARCPSVRTVGLGCVTGGRLTYVLVMASSSSGKSGSSQMPQKLCMAAGGFSAAALDTQRLVECLYSHGVLLNSII
jgi:hypothetical protein